MHTFEVRSPFRFNDFVEFDSASGSGRGFVRHIILSEVGEVWYALEVSEDELVFGVLPEDCTLLADVADGVFVRRPVTDGEGREAAADGRYNGPTEVTPCPSTTGRR